MKRYEKSAFIRFFTLFLGAFILIYLLLATLYYIQEHTRLKKESELVAQMHYIECMQLKVELECLLPKMHSQNMKEVNTRLFYVGLFFLLLFIPMSIGLALYAIKPVQKASNMIDHFISSVVHDINTPLTTIMLNVKSLIRKSEFSLQKLTYILSSSNQLLGMQHDLLALVDEKEEIVKEEISLHTMIQEIVAEFSIAHKQQEFRVDIEKQIAVVNRTDIYRILQNLLSNAVKYNRDNHLIQIRLKSKQLTIEDKGVGMKETNKVFERNYREYYTIEGNGIGLASVKSMADRNQIEITIKSKLNEGTKVVLNFQ